MNKKNKTKKIISLKYSERSLMYHPKTQEEFKMFLDRLDTQLKNKDWNGFIITAYNLIPDILEYED